MLNKVFIFDLDDTLIECHSNYAKIIAQFIQDIVNEFGYYTPHPIEIAQVQSNIDQNLVGEKKL